MENCGVSEFGSAMLRMLCAPPKGLLGRARGPVINSFARSPLSNARLEGRLSSKRLLAVLSVLVWRQGAQAFLSDVQPGNYHVQNSMTGQRLIRCVKNMCV